MQENIYFKRETLNIKSGELNFSTTNIDEYLNSLIYFSIIKNASDIHIETKESVIRVRVRVDGVLKDLNELNKSFGIKIIAKIKLLSELDIGEKRVPQDGRFKGDYEGIKIDFRVSILPTLFGERCVIRILKNEISSLKIENLGFTEENLTTLKNILNKRNGFLVFCGPTGSGKTTSLYTLVNYLSSEDRNIITIEDPIEYQLEEINQVQCKNEVGLNFSSVLRSVLRQDPDIILIGEIRDKETAEIALLASLTGHLVITTLHTKDSISAIDRFLNFGVDRFVLANSLSGIISQRLVRKICKNCLGKGCEMCNDGFKGREAIEEAIFFTREMRDIVLNGDGKALESYLKTTGFKDMLQNGKNKVEKGLTTEEEIIRECSI